MLFQVSAQFVCLTRIARIRRHGRRSAASAQHHARVLEVEIADERFVMRFQRLERPAVAVPCHGKQRRFHVFARQARVEGAEAVDQRFELRAHAVIIQRRREDYHVGAQDFAADVVGSVLLHARSFVSAADAACAGTNVRVRDVDDLDRVSRVFRSAAETVREHIGGAPAVGAALQYDNVHGIRSRQSPFRKERHLPSTLPVLR